MKYKNQWLNAIQACMLCIALLISEATWADTYNYGLAASLDGVQQVPPNGSTAMGTAKGSYDHSSNQLALSITVTGISTTALTGAHIHLGATGASGAILVNLGTSAWQVTATGMTLATTVTFPATNELDLLNGNTYINLHTAAHPGGEIRAQISVTASFVGFTASETLGVSADGNTVVGHTFVANKSGNQAFVWTPSKGRTMIPFPANVALICDDFGCAYKSEAVDVSGDGTAVALNSFVTIGSTVEKEAFRWSAATGLVGLGGLSTYPYSRSTDISADGATVVGNTGTQAFRWTATTGMVALPAQSPYVQGQVASGVSANGNVVVGGDGGDAVRWLASGGTTLLGDLPGDYGSTATSVSDDGTVVVGVGRLVVLGPNQAVRWVGDTAPALLTPALLNEYASLTNDLSGDAGTAVGPVTLRDPTTGALTRHAFIWTPATGKRLLTDVLNDRGVALQGWTLPNASSIARNGRTVVGTGAQNGVTMGYAAFLDRVVLPLANTADADGDGWGAPQDCNDSYAAIYPGAPEIKSDGIDQDCNGYDLTINITKATYSTSKRTLVVQATSALRASAGLSVDGFGTMTWDSRKSVWTLTATKITSAPSTVKVSGVEGSVTASVAITK